MLVWIFSLPIYVKQFEFAAKSTHDDFQNKPNDLLRALATRDDTESKYVNQRLNGRPQNKNANENACNCTYFDWRNSRIGSPDTFIQCYQLYPNPVTDDDNEIGKTEELVNTISINVVIGIHPAWLLVIQD